MRSASAPPSPRLELAALMLAGLELVVFAASLVVLAASPPVVPVPVVASVPAAVEVVVVDEDEDEDELEEAPPDWPETAVPGRFWV
jgi:hypothetical protein